MKRPRVPATTTTRRVRALILLPSPRTSGLSDAERLALTLRRDATVSGTCACGATMPRTRARRGVLVHVTIAHEHDCPASDPVVDRLAERLGSRMQFDYVVVDLEVAA